jgi:TP901 family phage tail tape measure protein
MSDKLELKVIFTAVDRFMRPVKNITEASRGASKALNEAKATLKGFNDQQKKIDSWRSTNKSLGINAQDLEKARAYAKKLGEQLEQTEKPTAAMQKAFKHATDEARNLAGTVNRLAEKKQRLRAELVAAGIDTKKVADYQRELKGKIDAATAAVERQDDVLKKARKQEQLMHAARAQGDKIRDLGARAGSYGRRAMAAGAGVTAAASVPVLAYANAEDASTQLKIAMMQKGGEVAAEFKQIDDLANRLGDRLPGTTADFQNMMTMLIRQGMPAKNILGGLGEATAYLGVLLKMAPEGAAEFASKLQDATRTADKDMMGLMDTIQRMSYLGVDQNNMLEAFKGLGPAMDLIKRQGLDGAKALAPFVVMMDQAGMRGESAGNAIRKVVARGLDVDKIKKVQDDLRTSKGINLDLDFTNGKGEFGGIDKLIGELSKLKKFDTVTRLSILKDIYGDDKETNEVLSKLVDKGKAGYEDVIARMESQAALQERVNAQLGTLKNLWDAASGTFTNALVVFGESISPELHATAEWLGTVAQGVKDWAKENPGLAHGLMTIAKWTGIGLVGFGGLLVVLSTLAAPIALMNLSLAGLGLSVGTVTSAVFALGRALLLNPIGLIVTGIATAAFLIYKYWEPITGFFSQLWSGVATATKLAWGELTTWFSSLPDYFKSIGTAITDGLWGGLKSGFDWVTEKLGGMAKGLPRPVETALDVHSPSRVFERIGAFTMQGLEQGIEGGQDSPLNAISKVARKVAAVGAGAAVFSGGAFASQPAADMRPPISAQQAASAGGQAAGGNTIIFNIYPSPGMDERALADAIANQFVRLENSRAARKRSALRDLE